MRLCLCVWVRVVVFEMSPQNIQPTSGSGSDNSAVTLPCGGAALNLHCFVSYHFPPTTKEKPPLRPRCDSQRHTSRWPQRLAGVAMAPPRRRSGGAVVAAPTAAGTKSAVTLFALEPKLHCHPQHKNGHGVSESCFPPTV